MRIVNLFPATGTMFKITYISKKKKKKMAELGKVLQGISILM